MKLLPAKKEKNKITLFFSLCARPCSHLPSARGRKDILATYFYAEEFFVSLISVKFAIRLSLLMIHEINHIWTAEMKWKWRSPEFFSGYFTQLHKLRSLRRSLLHFHRLSLLQPSFQGPLYFFSGASLLFRSRRGSWERGCVYCRIEHKTVVQSCYKSAKILSNPPENLYWAMTRDE